MSNQISSSATAARESARASDGRFGQQEHGRADQVDLSPGSHISGDVDPVDVAYKALDREQRLQLGVAMFAAARPYQDTDDPDIDLNDAAEDFHGRGVTAIGPFEAGDTELWASIAGVDPADPEAEPLSDSERDARLAQIAGAEGLPVTSQLEYTDYFDLDPDQQERLSKEGLSLYAHLASDDEWSREQKEEMSDRCARVARDVLGPTPAAVGQIRIRAMESASEALGDAADRAHGKYRTPLQAKREMAEMLFHEAAVEETTAALDGMRALGRERGAAYITFECEADPEGPQGSEALSMCPKFRNADGQSMPDLDEYASYKHGGDPRVVAWHQATRGTHITDRLDEDISYADLEGGARDAIKQSGFRRNFTC